MPTNSCCSPTDAVTLRAAQLAAFYRQVHHNRMAGISILNTALHVEPIGFKQALDETSTAEGVLITPWFLSLVRLPLLLQAHEDRVGHKQISSFGNEQFEFIGAHDPAVGFHETCTLFSRMADFETQADAQEVAVAVLAQLRTTSSPSQQAESVSSRRSFLFGRSHTRPSEQG